VSGRPRKLGVRHAICNKGLCQLGRVIGTSVAPFDPYRGGDPGRGTGRATTLSRV
jgi:hypothetical protein